MELGCKTLSCHCSLVLLENLTEKKKVPGVECEDYLYILGIKKEKKKKWWKTRQVAKEVVSSANKLGNIFSSLESLEHHAE